MLSVVKRTEDDLRAWLATEAGFIEAFVQNDGEPLRLEPFQKAFLEKRLPDFKGE